MVEFDFDWIQKIRADIAAVDFASYKGRNEFADILRRRYTARELFLFKEMAPEDWGAQTRADDLTCRELWGYALEEAQSLIVQIRAHGGGAITQPIVEKDATGEKMPNPEMLFDLPDGLWDLPIVTLRANAARAMGKTVMMQDVAAIAQRGVDAAEGNSRKLDEMLVELAQWRKWVQGISQSGDAPQLPLPTLCAGMRDAVVAKWNEYKDECATKCRATYQGCLDTHGADDVYKSATTGETYQLLVLAPSESTLKAIVHNAQVKQSAQNKPEAAEKSKSRQNRKRK